MSSLKYIFVIEGNQLVRKVKDEAEKQATEREAEVSVGESVIPPSKCPEEPEPKQRNKRNKTSRG